MEHEDWMRECGEVMYYVNEYGRPPLSGPESLPDECRAARWLFMQLKDAPRELKDKLPKLSKEQRMDLEISCVAAFVRKHDRMPDYLSSDVLERRLAKCVAHHDAAREEKLKQLDADPEFAKWSKFKSEWEYRDVDTVEWNSRMSDLRDFFKTHNRLPTAQGRDSRESALCAWMRAQQTVVFSNDFFRKYPVRVRAWRDMAAIVPGLDAPTELVEGDVFCVLCNVSVPRADKQIHIASKEHFMHENTNVPIGVDNFSCFT